MNKQNSGNSLRLSRRGLLQLGTAGILGRSLLSEPGPPTGATDVPRPHAPQYRFRVGASPLNPDGQGVVAGIAVNGQYPGPEIRLREGSMLRVEVENTLPNEPASIHWHGLLLPAGMDGVPDVSNSPIGPKRVFVYEYPLLQSGTYWYHSHWRLQEQIGMAGPFVIEAKDEPLRVDHDVVVFLGDWLHRSPMLRSRPLRKTRNRWRPAPRWAT